jgi:uncharacterized protein (TIGR03089 family)
MPDQTPADLLAAVLAADPARPLVTFYDDASGERVELSGKTFGNWVSKTANLLVDGLDAEPGERVLLALPPHWQTAVWLFACWSAGLVAEPVWPDDPAGGDLPSALAGVRADIVVAAEALLPVRPGDRPGPVGRGGLDAREVVGLSLHALGAPLTECPPGVVDYAVEVRSFGDHFAPYAPVDPDGAALVVTNDTFTGGALVRLARDAARDWGLDARTRVLASMPYITVNSVLAGLLAPLSANGSVIIQRNLDESSLERRITLEHVTAVAGVPAWDDRTAPVRRLL